MLIADLLTLERHPEWLLVRVAPVTYQWGLIRAIVAHALESLRSRQAPAVLVDGRAITGEISMIERILIAAWAGRLRLPVPFALVGHEPVVHPRRIGMVAARTRGVPVGVFTSMDEAVTWLASRRPAPGA